jgi:membrane-associated phospholipid phosphatase
MQRRPTLVSRAVVKADWCESLQAQNLRPFSLLLTVYDPSSIVSRLLAYVTVLPPLSFVFLIGVLLASRRRGRVLQLIVTLLVSFVLNETVKNVIQQPRPPRSWMHGHGYPSSHAASIATSFAFVECLFHAGVWSVPRFTRALWRVGMTLLVVAVVTARVSSHAHSLEQCVAGVVVGAVYAIASYALVPNSVVDAADRATQRLADFLLGARTDDSSKRD